MWHLPALFGFQVYMVIGRDFECVLWETLQTGKMKKVKNNSTRNAVTFVNQCVYCVRQRSMYKHTARMGFDK